MANITVRELANELGRTVQGINKYLRQSGLQGRAIKEGNKYLLPEDLANEVRNHFCKRSETETETETNPETAPTPEFQNESGKRESRREGRSADSRAEDPAIQALVQQLEVLQKQIEIKDRQIEALSDALASATETNKALSATQAVQVVADKKRELMVPVEEELPKEEKKKGFFARFFG